MCTFPSFDAADDEVERQGKALVVDCGHVPATIVHSCFEIGTPVAPSWHQFVIRHITVQLIHSSSLDWQICAD